VQSAEYGAGNRRQDVTQTVRRLVGGPNFRVNNTTMGGDPWPGADKTLRIVGRDSQGNVRDFKYGEGSTVNSSMFRGSGWGSGPGGIVPGGPNNMLQITSAQWGSGNRFQNVSQRLQNMVRNNRLSVKVTPQDMGGDPTPGVSKKVIVDYRYQGRQQRVTRLEGEMLNLP
jgi:predicted aconitase with swiveling domain